MGERGTLRTTWILPDDSAIDVEVSFIPLRGCQASEASLDHAGRPGEPDSVDIEAAFLVTRGVVGSRLRRELENAICDDPKIIEACVFAAFANGQRA